MQQGEYNLSDMPFKGFSLHFTFMLLLAKTGRAHHGNILLQTAKLVDEGAFQSLVYE